MFGERYFTARQHLARLMRQIHALGSQHGIDLSSHLPLAELESGSLGAPFSLVVCGGTNAGKSAFLNALMGRQICPMSALPNTDRVNIYRYGDPASDTDAGPLLREARRPLVILRDFHLVDTPGLRAEPDEVSRLLEPLLEVADALFVVLPFDNPWGAPAWNLVSCLPPLMLDRTILIVQQADRANPADLPVIEGHLRDLAVKKVGRALPVFPVSAKLAYEARQSQPEDTARLVASGFANLECHLSAAVCGTPARHALLAAWRDQADTALRAVEDRFDWNEQLVRERHQFLRLMEADIIRLREHFILRLPDHLGRVAEIFQREAVGVTRFLRKKLGTARSIISAFLGDRTIHAVEAVFVERLQAAVESVAQLDGDEVVAVCREHRQQLVRQVKESTGVDLAQAAGERDGKLEEARAWFVERVGCAARDGIGNLQVRSQLAKDLVRRNRAIKSFLCVCLLLATAAGVSGALGFHPWPAMGLLGGAALFLLGGALVAWLAMRRVSGDFQDRLLDTCAGFANALKADYEAALKVVFQEHLENLAPLRQHLATAQAALEPARKRWSELFLTLKSIEQDHLS
jgi:hypothetical protein